MNEQFSTNEMPKEKVMVGPHELTQIGQGGEHLVFAIEKKPGFVVKVPTEALSSSIQQHDDPKMLAEKGAEYVQSENKRYAVLRDFFGKDHVLQQKTIFYPIPIAGIKLPESLREFNLEGIDTLQVVMRLQRDASVIYSAKERESVTAGYSERNTDLNQTIYDKLTDQTIGGIGEGKVDLEELLAIQRNKSLAELTKKASSDPQLMGQLKDFLDKTIDYSNATGESLDIGGTDNVLFYKNEQKGGDWDYVLPDALYPDKIEEFPILERVEHAFQELADGKDLDESEFSDLINGVNYLRTINGLAQVFGIEGQIEIDRPESVTAQNIYDIAKRIQDPEKWYPKEL